MLANLMFYLFQEFYRSLKVKWTNIQIQVYTYKIEELSLKLNISVIFADNIGQIIICSIITEHTLLLKDTKKKSNTDLFCVISKER